MSRKFLLLFMILTQLAAIGAANASDLQITSTEPETLVIDVTNPLSKKEMGRTPLLLKDYDGSETKVFTLEKPGFAPVYIPVSGGLSKNVTIAVNLKRVIDWTPEELTRKSMETAEGMVDQIMTVQALLDNRKMKEALPLLETMKSEHPRSISVRLIYANALLINGEVARADSMYATLMGEIPESRKYLRDSIELVRSRLNGMRRPASAGGKK